MYLGKNKGEPRCCMCDMDLLKHELESYEISLKRFDKFHMKFVGHYETPEKDPIAKKKLFRFCSKCYMELAGKEWAL